MKNNNFLSEIFAEWFPVRQKSEIFSNLKHNWYFPFSAISFFLLSASLTKGYILALPFAFFAAIVIASQIPSMLSYTKKHSVKYQIISIATALGICLNAQDSFYYDWSNSPKAVALKAKLPAGIDAPFIASVVGAVCALFFVYFFVLVFFKKLSAILGDCKIFTSIKKSEWIIYSLLILVSLGFVTYVFTQTNAFYGSNLFDVIYTSDSSSLVQRNAYMTLTHTENDLRQPLFSIFAAPFTGIVYLIGRFISSQSIQAVLMNSVQIVMLFGANLILAKMMKLDSIKRICFMVLTCCTYTQLLFTLMMEQYIVAYFWLILCVYLISEKKQHTIALCGAGGTLLTSMALLPVYSNHSPAKAFKAWFYDTVKHGLEFLGAMIVFCRLDVIVNIGAQSSALSTYSGHSLTFTDKINQYFAFIRGFFAAPEAGINAKDFEHISWQLIPATTLSIVGTVILALSVLSAIINRKEKSALIALGWIGFSVVMLLGLGWGTKENGLVLYSLYFGWAFLMLLFKLVDKIENKLKINYLVPTITVASVAVLLYINIPKVIEMVNFAINNYPAL